MRRSVHCPHLLPDGQRNLSGLTLGKLIELVAPAVIELMPLRACEAIDLDGNMAALPDLAENPDGQYDPAADGEFRALPLCSHKGRYERDPVDVAESWTGSESQAAWEMAAPERAAA